MGKLQRLHLSELRLCGFSFQPRRVAKGGPSDRYQRYSGQPSHPPSTKKRQRGLKEFRQMVREADDGIAAGRVGPFDAEETKRAVRERLSQHGIAG